MFLWNVLTLKSMPVGAVAAVFVVIGVPSSFPKYGKGRRRGSGGKFSGRNFW